MEVKLNYSKEELFQKHLEFEMSLVQSEKLHFTLLDDLNFFYEQIEDETLASLFPKDQVEQKVLQLLEKLEITEELLNFIQEVIDKIIEYVQQDDSSVSSRLDPESFQTLLKALLSFKELRNKAVHFVVHSPAYSRMISNILYSSIKDFLITQNPLTKNNPLGSSILKLGQDILNSLPGMEGNFDKKITEFIEKNLSGRIQESENFIIHELDSDNTKEIIQEIWKFLETATFSEIASTVSSENVREVIETFPGFWKHLKTKNIISRYIKDLIARIYSKYSEKKISELLIEFGFSQETTIPFLAKNLSSILDNEKFRTQYKQFISRRLKMFYDTL